MSHPPSAPPPHGDPYGGQPPYGFGSGQGPEPKKGIGGGVIAAIAGFVALLLAVCCLGGYFLLRDDDDSESGSGATTSEESSEEPTDDEPTDEPSEETTDESTDEPSEETTDDPTEEPSEGPSDDPTDEPGDATLNFPESFDGWSNPSSQPSATIAIYVKDEQSFNILSAGYASVETYEKLWDSTETYGEISCGQRSGHAAVSCAIEEHDTTYYATSSDLSEEELAGAVEAMLEEM